MLWRTILALLAFIIVMGIIGLIWRRKEGLKKSAGEEVEKIAGNVVDLNDNFNRARYMDQDKG